jgi:hypothetical protein
VQRMGVSVDDDDRWSVTGNRQAGHIFGVVVAGIGVAVAISMSSAQTMSQPRPLNQFLEENGWVPLRMPDRRMGPGSVIRATKKDNAVSVQWLGNLRRCGITDGEFGFVRGKYPSIGIGLAFGVKASMTAGYIAKLGGTVDFERADRAIVQIEGSGGDAVDLAALAAWLAKPGASRRMSPVCNNFLTQNDVYLVSEAFRISKAVYDLVDKDGTRLAVAGAAFAQTGSGTLSVAEDLYVGVRRVKQLAPALFEPGLRPQAVPEADGLLRLMAP